MRRDPQGCRSWIPQGEGLARKHNGHSAVCIETSPPTLLRGAASTGGPSFIAGYLLNFNQVQPTVKKLNLSGSLHREVADAEKDWFGYINLPESSLNDFAELIRNSPRVADRNGGQVVRLKLYGWNRQSNGKNWIKFVFG